MMVFIHCTAPLNFRTACGTLVPIHLAENSALFEPPLLKGHPGALARDSFERASAIFLYDGFRKFQWVSCIQLTKPPVHIINGAQQDGVATLSLSSGFVYVLSIGAKS